MLKKSLFLSAGVAAIALVALSIPSASADYYDCNGVFHSGSPSPSECHYFLTPQSSQTTVTSDREQRGTVTDTSSGDRYQRGTITDTSSGSSSSYTDYDRQRVNVIQDISRSYSDYDDARNQPGAVIVNDPDNYSKKYERRNERKYCVRDYCYVVYDYCYDLTHCEERTERLPREEYQDATEDRYSNDRGDRNYWYTWINNYINNYYNSRPEKRGCDYRTQRCDIYRGFHFGGFHNGYWYY